MKKRGTQSQRLNFKHGFTLIEVLVSLFIFTLIVYGLIGLVSNILTINRQQGGSLADTDQSRKLVFTIAAELRNGQTGSNGAYVIDNADDQEIIFYGNADNDASVERIRYFLQKGKLYKGITEYNGTTYDVASEKTRIVQNDVANNSTTPIFIYYNGNYTGGAGQNPLTQPVNVTAVKFVKINLQVLKIAGVKNTSFYTATAGAAIRNLKTNLGN